METTESNKLIAEFMSWKNPEGTVYITDHFQSYMAVDSNMYDTCRYRIVEFKFQTSWDWLMPVVEKIGIIIGKNNFEDFEDWEDYYITWNEVSLLYFNIEIWYKNVVEFIEWYNEQKTEIKMK
tara:strand:- start:73151 stop:73519 length:369 start_codon:yes stop_codon:yes gene_type:complete